MILLRGHTFTWYPHLSIFHYQHFLSLGILIPYVSLDFVLLLASLSLKNPWILFIKVLFLVSFWSHWHTFGIMSFSYSVIYFNSVIQFCRFLFVFQPAGIHLECLFMVQKLCWDLALLFCGRFDHYSICYHCQSYAEYFQCSQSTGRSILTIHAKPSNKRHCIIGIMNLYLSIYYFM